MIHKSLLAIALSLSMFGMTACNKYSIAVGVSNGINALLQVAQAEAQEVPAQDQQTYNGFVSLGQTLHTQLNTCLTAANSSILGKSGKFLACFNAFVQGLTSPTELAQLRVMNPATTSRVQRILTGFIIGVNVGIGTFGGTQATTPSVSAQATTPEELNALAAEAHINWAY
jgi:hypothetical protein